MASGPITSWQIDGETVETVDRLYFLGLQKSLQMVTSVMKLKDTCPLEKKKKNYDKPRQCNKNRDITLPTKVCTVKAMVFPVVTYGCEGCTIKKAER